MYFITCFEKISTTLLGWLDIGSSRTFGFYSIYEQAVEALHNNYLDMFECLYEYAVVEHINEGIHPEVISRQFFSYNRKRKGFFEKNEPKEFKGYCNIALG